MIYRLFLFLTVLLTSTAAHAGYFGPMTASITPVAPNAPTSLAATQASATTVALTWTNSTVGYPTPTYDIYRSTSSGTETLWQSNKTSGYVDTVTTGQVYYYVVKATNSQGTVACTSPSEVNITTSAAPTAPGAPTGVTATAGNAQATVTFTAPASDGGSAITGYTVTSSPAGGTDSNAGSTSLSHVVTSLTNGTAYTFTVTATNAAGTSAASSASNSVTPSAGGVYAGPYTFDGTAGTAPDSSFFTVFAAGSGAANLDGSGNLYIRNPSASTDGALVYRTNALDYNTTKTYKVKVKTNTSLIAAAAGGAAMQVIHATAKAGPLGAGNDASIEAIDWVLTNDSGIKALARYIDSSGSLHELNGSMAWTAAGVGATTYPVSLTNDTYYWFYLYTTATGWSVGAKAANDTTDVVAKTAEITWANTKALAGGESFWLRMGDKYSYAWQFGEYIDTYSEQ